MVEISIILPIFNAENYLNTCINSILMQDFSDFEIICVDDCSTDNSFSILNRFKNDNRVKFFKNESRKGLNYCKELGINISKGKYIYFMDQYSWLDFNALSKLYDNSEEYNLDCIIFSRGL